MIVYHGTTVRSARRICVEGFHPHRPSGRVWFAKGREYARRRARTKAQRAHDRPVVLTCEINVAGLRATLGPGRVFLGGGSLAIVGSISPNVLRSHAGGEAPNSPAHLARWVNRLLGLRPGRGVGRKHPGIERLSRWVDRRLAHQPDAAIQPSELLELARQWLPEHFVGVRVDPKTLHVERVFRPAGADEFADLEAEGLGEVRPGPDDAERATREAEALRCMDDPKPRRRARGLAILADLDEPDLFDWCVMCLGDESPTVRVAALRTLRRCDQADPDSVRPLADSPSRTVRAAAIAALARGGGADAADWFARGLKDPSPCVRVETAAVLAELDPADGPNRPLFELALYDSNPKVVQLAEKLTAGKGFARLRW